MGEKDVRDCAMPRFAFGTPHSLGLVRRKKKKAGRLPVRPGETRRASYCLAR